MYPFICLKIEAYNKMPQDPIQNDTTDSLNCGTNDDWKKKLE